VDTGGRSAEQSAEDLHRAALELLEREGAPIDSTQKDAL